MLLEDDPPALVLATGKELWELARMENWADLETLVHQFDGFYIRDENAEKHLYDEIRAPFDGCCTPSDGSPGRSFLSSLLAADGRHQSSSIDELVERLLALGLHPDLQTSGNGARWRPSHYCSWNNRVETAQVLRVCRPDLGAKDVGGFTPRSIGEHGEDLWRDVEREGFPIIARLAYEKKWWAVRNLSRRRVVTEDEKFHAYKGKTAFQWAKNYGLEEQAQELNYLLNSGPPMYPSSSSKADRIWPQQLQAISDRVTTLQEKVACDHAGLAIKFNALMVEENQEKLLHIASQQQCEADELRELFALCVLRVAEDAVNMRSDMVALCEARLAEEREECGREMKSLKRELLARMREAIATSRSPVLRWEELGYRSEVKLGSTTRTRRCISAMRDTKATHLIGNKPFNQHARIDIYRTAM